MPTLQDIKRRIGSVKKTQQITRAMRMVAGAKLRRAQQAIESARPYAERMTATLAEVAAAQGGEAEHPLLEQRESVRHVEFVVVTSDRGLCGAFNANIFKHAEPLIAQRQASGAGVTITTAGKKIRDHYKRHRASLLADDFPQAGWVQFRVRWTGSTCWLPKRSATFEQAWSASCAFKVNLSNCIAIAKPFFQPISIIGWELPGLHTTGGPNLLRINFQVIPSRQAHNRNYISLVG